MGRYLLVLLFVAVGWATDAQLYCSPETIDHTKVPTADQSDFPVLFSKTDDRFKTATYGGHVANASGYDLIPYSNSTCTARLSFERESYSATSGAVLAWVKVPTVSHTVNTTYYWGYGDTGITTDQQDAASVWTNGFLAVWHLGAASGTFADSTGGGHTGTASGTITYGAAGAIGLGVSQNTSGYIDAGSNNDIKVNRNWTFSAWINRPSFAAVRSIMGRTYGPFFRTTDTGKLNFLQSSTAQIKTADTTLGVDTWYYVGVTLGTGATASGSIYLNGATDGDFSTSIDFTDLTQNTLLGSDYSASDLFNGTMDEMRIASTARSADWLMTEFNNQANPSTFSTLGVEVPLGGGARRRVVIP